jgi:hypothetical protein
MSLTPRQRATRASIGGSALAAKHDPHEYTKAARTAFLERFITQVDPEGRLPVPERDRRAAAALRAHMARIALKSSLARSRKARHQAG